MAKATKNFHPLASTVLRKWLSVTSLWEGTENDRRKSEPHFRLLRKEAQVVLIAFLELFQSVPVYTCATRACEIHLLSSLWLCRVQWRDENMGVPTQPHQWQFLNSLTSQSSFPVLCLWLMQWTTLLLLLNVMMVLAEPLVVFYKGRCKIFISCYWKAWSNHLLLKLWWTLWLIWPKDLVRS